MLIIWVNMEFYTSHCNGRLAIKLNEKLKRYVTGPPYWDSILYNKITSIKAAYLSKNYNDINFQGSVLSSAHVMSTSFVSC